MNELRTQAREGLVCFSSTALLSEEIKNGEELGEKLKLHFLLGLPDNGVWGLGWCHPTDPPSPSPEIVGSSEGQKSPPHCPTVRPTRHTPRQEQLPRPCLRSTRRIKQPQGREIFTRHGENQMRAHDRNTHGCFFSDSRISRPTSLSLAGTGYLCLLCNLSHPALFF